MTPPPVASQIATPSPVSLRALPPAHPAQRLSLLLDASNWSRMRILIDALVLYIAACAALFPDSAVRTATSNHFVAAAFPILVLAILHARRAPDDRLSGSMLDTASNVLGVVSLSVMLLIVVDAVLGTAHPLGLALRLWLYSVVYLGMGRLVLLAVRRQAVRSDACAIPTLIVGAGAVGERLVERLQGDRRYGLRPVGFLDDNPLPRPDGVESLGVPVLGGAKDLARAIKETHARQVILAFSTEPDSVLVDQVNACQQLGVEVALVPRLYETISDRSELDHVGGLPLLYVRPTDPRGWQFAVKHMIDAVVAFISVIVLSPLMLAIAVAVRLSSPGPILFRQQRVGRDGRVFTMFKFRSMRGSPSAQGEADAPWAATIVNGSSATDSTHAHPSESRTTAIGRLLRASSLDELPQLINVLRGDMSLVGPRPERVAYVRNFEQHISRYTDRHRVKSGLTGWAQVNGLRGQTSLEDRIEWDNYYIRNWSLTLDFKILALTVAEVLRFRSGQ